MNRLSTADILFVLSIKISIADNTHMVSKKFWRLYLVAKIKLKPLSRILICSAEVTKQLHFLSTKRVKASTKSVLISIFLCINNAVLRN